MFLKGGLPGAILGGWQLQTITSWISGLPFTVTGNTGQLNTAGNTQTAQLLVPQLQIYGAHNRNAAGQVAYFNPANFGSAGTVFGNTGRNQFRGPGAFDLDAGVKRSIHIYEGVSVEFQAEAFSLTNTPIFGNPTADQTNTANGVISTATGNRKVRLSARIKF